MNTNQTPRPAPAALHAEAAKLDALACRLREHAAAVRDQAHRDRLTALAHATARKVFGSPVQSMPPYKPRKIDGKAPSRAVVKADVAE